MSFPETSAMFRYRFADGTAMLEVLSFPATLDLRMADHSKVFGAQLSALASGFAINSGQPGRNIRVRERLREYEHRRWENVSDQYSYQHDHGQDHRCLSQNNSRRSPDGNHLYQGTYASSMFVIETNANTIVNTLPSIGTSNRAIAFGPGGSRTHIAGEY
jgi:hypothetical protein